MSTEWQNIRTQLLILDALFSQGALCRKEPVRIIRVKRITLAMIYQIVCLSWRSPLMS